MRNNLVVIAFETEDKADQVLETLKNVEHQGFMSLEDTVVVRKDADGKVYSRNAMDKTTKEGIAVGGLIGLFLGALFGGPLGMLLVGGLGGGAVGALLNRGVDKLSLIHI